MTREFIARLEAAGIPTTLRDTRGKEIDGACGQLAAADAWAGAAQGLQRGPDVDQHDAADGRCRGLT